MDYRFNDEQYNTLVDIYEAHKELIVGYQEALDSSHEVFEAKDKLIEALYNRIKILEAKDLEELKELKKIA